MAAAATIGALRVVLGADIASFETGMKNAETRLSKFSANIGKVAAGIGVAMAGAAVAFGVAIKGAINEADKIGKMAQKFGVPVDELSRLKHAADLSGVGLDSLGTAMGRLSKNMFEAAQGSGTAGNAFKQLGINVKNAGGTLKSADQIMTEVADRFAGMEDGATKTALAIAIFGRAGADLIPMLNQGGKALEEMKDEADKFGIVVTERTAKAAEKFNDTLTRLGKVKEGLILKITEEMLPNLNALASLFLKTAADGDHLNATGLAMGKWMTDLGVEAIRAVGDLIAVGQALKTLGNLAHEFITGRWAGLTSTFMEGRAEIEKTRGEYDKLANSFRDAATSVPIGQSMFGDFSSSARDAGKAVRDFSEEKKRASEVDREWRNTLRDANRTIEEARTPLEEYKFRLMEITTQLQQGLISADQWASVQQKAAERAGISFNALATVTAGAFGDIGDAFKTFGKQNEDLFRVGQAFGIAEAIVSSYVAFTKALASGVPPVNYIVAAAVLAKGLAAVATIAATKPAGFAMGGSFKVPGGESFTDNKMIPLNIASGERVDVTRDRTSGGGRELVIPPIRPKDFFTGETVREMINSIDQWMRDGGSGIRWKTA